MDVDTFVDELSRVRLANVFNPYRDSCACSDHAESAVIRKRNLRLLLEASASEGIRSLWVGRDLGYRGGRRTGLALTDEFHLGKLRQAYRLPGVVKATIDSIDVKERTACEVWKVLSQLEERVLLWNAFPFHPHEQGIPLSNRRHTRKEFAMCEHLLEALIEWFAPAIIVALGADADSAVRRVGYDCYRVRHPSYGGHITFARQIACIYRIQSDCDNRSYNF